MPKIFRQSLRPFPRLATALALLLLSAGSAFADALVTVELRDAKGKPADGEVMLVDAQGATRARCTTAGGKCQMEGVPGGSYSAKVVPKQGKAPKPRKVMIPPAGKVSLIVSTADE